MAGKKVAALHLDRGAGRLVISDKTGLDIVEIESREKGGSGNY